MSQSDFTNFESFENVIGLSSGPIEAFAEMWYQVFLWALFSSLFVHVIAALIAVRALHKHRYGRFLPVAILAMGIIGPCTGGVITSATVAGVHRSAGFTMAPLYALVWGLGQTLVTCVISFVRILATL